MIETSSDTLGHSSALNTKKVKKEFGIL